MSLLALTQERLDRRCGALTKRAPQHPCGQARGSRTDHPGTGRCWLHGGRTPNGRTFARREAARNALRVLHIETSVDPLASLFEAVRVAAWREAGLRSMLAVRPALFGADHLGDLRPDVVATMHAEALDARARIAKLAIDAKIDDRLVRLAEREAEVIIRAVNAALDAARVHGARRSAGEDAARAVLLEADELVPVAPSGAERN